MLLATSSCAVPRAICQQRCATLQCHPPTQPFSSSPIVFFSLAASSGDLNSSSAGLILSGTMPRRCASTSSYAGVQGRGCSMAGWPQRRNPNNSKPSNEIDRIFVVAAVDSCRSPSPSVPLVSSPLYHLKCCTIVTAPCSHLNNGGVVDHEHVLDRHGGNLRNQDAPQRVGNGWVRPCANDKQRGRISAAVV